MNIFHCIQTNLIFCRGEYLRLFRTLIFLRRKNNPHGEFLWSPPAVGTLSLRRAVLHWAPLVAPRRWAGRARRARRAQCLGGLTPQQRRTPGGASIVGITFPILPWNASKNWNGTNMGIETNPKKTEGIRIIRLGI